MTKPASKEGAIAKAKLKVKIETKDWSGEYEVENGFQAIKRFFQDVRDKKIGLDQVGLLGTWLRSDGEKIAFRIPPTLFNMGLISAETYRASLAAGGMDMEPEELLKLAVEDSWMAEMLDRTRPR